MVNDELVAALMCLKDLEEERLGGAIRSLTLPIAQQTKGGCHLS